MSGDAKKPWSGVGADEIESALEEAFSEAIPDEDARYDPFASTGEDEEAPVLPLLELSLPEPDAPSSPSAAPASPPGAPSTELDAAWRRAAANLDDVGAQQRFVQACLADGELRFAVRCYRTLAEPPHADPRAAAQLKKVGALLGFHAPPARVGDDAMSPRLKLMLASIVLAALAVSGAAWWLG